MLLKIVEYPAKILRKKAKEVGPIDDAIKNLIDDMAETMQAAPGIGLAANQVGIAKQIIVIDIGDGLRVLINPKIISKKGKQVCSEGCLSFPGMEFEGIKRPQKIEVLYLDKRGERRILKADDFLARVVCHEIDHLDGKTILDRTGMFKKIKLVKKIKKSKRLNQAK